MSAPWSTSTDDDLTKDTRLCVFFTPGSKRRLTFVVEKAENGEETYPEFLVEAACSPFLYTVPSFDVISVKLRQLKVLGRDSEGKETPYDIFIRSYNTTTPPLPALLFVKEATVVKVRSKIYLAILTNTFYHYNQEEEFKRSVNIDGLSLFPFGCLVVWDWEWETTDDNSSEEETETDGQSQFNHHINTDESETDENEQAIPASVPLETHVVTFKCMGTLFERSRQNALEKTAELMCKGESVPVKLVPEPENKYDSKAIAFHCELEGKWYSIGYVVRDVLDVMHAALQENSIISVKFAWVKYRVVWMRSGPGYYAGIDIARKGKWPKIVVQHASTH